MSPEAIPSAQQNLQQETTHVDTGARTNLSSSDVLIISWFSKETFTSRKANTQNSLGCTSTNFPTRWCGHELVCE